MSVDKRSVHTDALASLGTIIDEGERDAIHLAVEPVIAGMELWAGQHIGIVNGKATTKTNKHLGIVDPFVKGPIPEGSKFWLIVYPRQITSLRHVWSHPDFDTIKVSSTEDDFDVSQYWMKRYAESVGTDYSTIMKGADEYQSTWTWNNEYGYADGEGMNLGSVLDGLSTPDEFWDHYSVIRGKSLEEKRRGNFFRCSC